jgi:hypothetical protein
MSVESANREAEGAVPDIQLMEPCAFACGDFVVGACGSSRGSVCCAPRGEWTVALAVRVGNRRGEWTSPPRLGQGWK